MRIETGEDNPQVGAILFADPAALELMRGLVRACPVEMAGFALITVAEPDRLLLTSPEDIIVPKQVATAGSVEPDPGAEAMANYEAVLLGRNLDLHLQFHGHPGTGPQSAYFSATDMRKIMAYGTQGVTWMVSIVFDSDGKYYTARLDQYTPVRTSSPLEIRPLLPTFDVEDHARKLLEESVRRRVPVGRPPARGKQRFREIGVFDPVPVVGARN